MASTPTTPRQPEAAHEDRLALSRLLFDVYSTIDHKTLSGARTSRSVNDGYYEDNEMVDVSAEVPAPSKLPEELTMDSVLANALQYLQLLTFGTIISSGAHEYSHHELVVNLRRFLPAEDEGVPHVRMDNDKVLEYLHLALRTVLSQVESGNQPYEPVARFVQGSIATTSNNPSSSAYESAVQQQEPEVSQTAPILIRGTSGARSAVFDTGSANWLPGVTRGPTESVASNNSSSNPWAAEPISVRSSLASYASCHEAGFPDSARSFSNCSIAPSESASNIPSSAPSGASTSSSFESKSSYRSSRETGGQSDWSISPTVSNCSIAPSESVSQVKHYAVKNHYTWEAHPYRMYRYEEGLPPMRSCFIVGGSPVLYENVNGDRARSATGWTEVRRTISRQNEEAAHLAMCMDEEMEEPSAETSSSYESPRDYSSSSDAAASGPGPEAAEEPRLAMGLGSIERGLGPDATEAERVEYALDVIDQTIDQWFADNK